MHPKISHALLADAELGRRSADWSHLFRELGRREEVPEAETVDQAGEDGVVRPPLASHRALTAPVPVSFI